MGHVPTSINTLTSKQLLTSRKKPIYYKSFKMQVHATSKWDRTYSKPTFKTRLTHVKFYCRDSTRKILQLREHKASNWRRCRICPVHRVQCGFIGESSTITSLSVRGYLGIQFHSVSSFSTWKMWVSNRIPFTFWAIEFARWILITLPGLISYLFNFSPCEKGYCNLGFNVFINKLVFKD